MISSLVLWTLMIFIGLEFAERRLLPEGPTLELNGVPAYTIGAFGLLFIIASLFWTHVKKSFRRQDER
ncbi:hypothetical protein ACVLD2_001107 [Paenibacillus sp. PvR052]